MNVEQHREKLLQIIVGLIENNGVTQFYSGFRGDFDIYCSCLIGQLKGKYPNVKNTMVLSYIPEASIRSDKAFVLPPCFDDSVYLLERYVPKRYAIIETNKLLVSIADYIVAGVILPFGGAYAACQYARKINKSIFNVIDSLEI